MKQVTPIFRKMSASRQLAQELRLSIQQGKWLSGAQLPTVRQLASDYDVSLNTVHAALKQLVADDLVECKPRQGGFVKAVSQWADHVSATAPRQVAVIRPTSPGEDPHVDETQQTGEITHGIELELQKHDLHPVLLSFEVGDPEAVSKLIRQIDRLRVQLVGVVVFAVGMLRQELFEQLDDWNMTWVTVNRLDPRMLDNFVNPDQLHCGDQIGRCLAYAGVNRVLVLGQRTVSDVERIAGIMQGYWSQSQNLLKADLLHVPDWREGPAYETTLNYLRDAATTPQAIVGLGDMIAVGAMQALQERGVRVPDEAGVITTTNLAISSYSSPPLTSYHTSRGTIGNMAAQMLMEMLQSGLRRIRGRFVSGQMIFRQSFVLSADLQDKIQMPAADPSLVISPAPSALLKKALSSAV
jgi:LacI family transcriptional regulator